MANDELMESPCDVNGIDDASNDVAFSCDELVCSRMNSALMISISCQLLCDLCHPYHGADPLLLAVDRIVSLPLRR